MRDHCTADSPLRWMRHAIAALGILIGFVAAPAWAQGTEPAELAVHPKNVELVGQNLQRNGVGIRYKAIFKVYSAGLYLEKPASSLEEVLALQGPKRLSVHMLRTVKASELGKLFAHGMEDNMDKQQFSKLIPGVMRMSELFGRYKDMQAGDEFTVDWIPGKGMRVSVNGKPDPAEFNEPEFFNAMMGIWLGPKAADGRLKQALLGNAPT